MFFFYKNSNIFHKRKTYIILSYVFFYNINNIFFMGEVKAETTRVNKWIIYKRGRGKKKERSKLHSQLNLI